MITRSAAIALKRQIEHRLIKTYRDVDAKGVMTLYQPLMDRIFATVDPEKYCLPVLTMNYDTAIERFCAEDGRSSV
jgi:hypothetical protein